MTTENTLSPTLKLAYEILSEANEAMHVNLISSLAVKSNKNMGLTEDELAKKLSSSLSQNLKTKTPLFAKVKNKNGSLKKGIYKLRVKKIQEQKLPTPTFEDLNTLYTGKAGEYAAMSELLFWGFNVSLMAVDDGIDIIAIKNNKYFHIQVKSTTEKADAKAFFFSISRSTFDAHNNSTTFYVLVLRSKHHTEYFVLPSTEIDRLLKLGKLSTGNNISLRVTLDTKLKRYFLSGSEDLSPYRNAFDRIR